MNKIRSFAVHSCLYKGFVVLLFIQFGAVFALANNPIVSDASGLNPIKVAVIIQPTSSNEIILAIKNSNGKISIGGAKYSMGGQIAYQNSVHLDMRQFNKIINFDKNAQTITVQSGITWRDIQSYIDPYGLSISVMQSYANFTLGGSLSVNAHGRYIGAGALIESVIFFKIVLANGKEIIASRQQNSEVFYGAIGGYGGLGVITEIGLKLVKNVKVARKTVLMKVTDYAQYFARNINNNAEIVFQNGDLYAPNYDEIRSIVWHKTDKELSIKDKLIDKNANYFFTKKMTEFVANYTIGKYFRKNIIDPIRYFFTSIVWRNYEASYDVNELPSNQENTLYALREYFIPVENFAIFVASMKEIFTHNKVNVINVSVRHAKPAPKSLLSWANNEVFALVVYYQQKTDNKSIAQVKKWSLKMLDATLKLDGSYYLPYQIFASNAQFNAAYPNANQFFALKQTLDPNNRFSNQLWRKYYPKRK